VQLAVHLPDHRSLPWTPTPSSARAVAATTLQPAMAPRDAPPAAAAAPASDPPPQHHALDHRRTQPARPDEHRTGVLDDATQATAARTRPRPRRAHRPRTVGARSPATRSATPRRQHQPAPRPRANHAIKHTRSAARSRANPAHPASDEAAWPRDRTVSRHRRGRASNPGVSWLRPIGIWPGPDEAAPRNSPARPRSARDW
jgi:hypothetical protein